MTAASQRALASQAPVERTHASLVRAAPVSDQVPDLPMLACEAVLRGHTACVWSAAWSPCGTMLATCGGDKTVRLWRQDAAGVWSNWTVLEEGHTRTVRSCAWSPCGRFIASASFDGTTAVWQLLADKFELVATLEGHENEVKCAAWSPSGQYLATCGRDKSIWVWEVDEDCEFECAAVLHGHTQDVKFALWMPDSDTLLSTSYDDTIKVWRSADEDWVCTDTLTAHASTVWRLALSPDAALLASCSDDRSIIVWTPSAASTDGTKRASWQPACRITGYHTRAIFSVDWGRHGMLASAAADNSIKLFQASPKPSGSDELAFDLVLAVEQAHDADVNSVAWNPAQPDLLASTGDDEVVKLWRLKSAVDG